MRLIGLVLLSCAVFGQNAETVPTFDLADVHLDTHPATLEARVLGTRGAILRAAGRYEFTYATMIDLVRNAYNVDADKVLGGPSWLESDHFDIIAQTSPKTSADTAKLMLRSLLADRFKLVVHKEDRALPTYALVVGKGGHKLKPSEGGESGCKMTQQAGGGIQASQLDAAIQSGTGITLNLPTFLYACTNMTMAAFAEQMHGMVVAQAYLGNNAIADRTALAGSFDFNFKYTQKPPATQPTLNTANGAVTVTMAGDNITMFDAMDKQLGLHLDPVTIPIPVIVVDSANRKPTDNSPEAVAKLVVQAPREFELAELRMTAAGTPNTVRGRGYQPNGQIELRNFPLKSLFAVGWDLTSVDDLADAPKWMDAARIDLIAKTVPLGTPIDIELVRPEMRALLMDRFGAKVHTEMRPGTGWLLTATKPKLAKADPEGRTLCKEGPGKDGKDPRKPNSTVTRLVSCQNITMAEFVGQLPTLASGYFRITDTIVDGTGLTDAYDFTVNFSPPTLVPGTLVSRALAGAGVAAPAGAAGAGGASDPNGAISLFDAMVKQLGLKVEPQKRDVPTLVLDHIDEKPKED